MKTGPKSDLTEELTLKIRKEVLNGKKYVDIQTEFDISPNTWDTWVYKDYKDFRANLNKWKAERLIKKSEDTSEEILDMITVDDSGKIASDLLRIKQKESEFVRSTLGKESYASRKELTGAGGERLIEHSEELNRLKQLLPENEGTEDTTTS